MNKTIRASDLREGDKIIDNGTVFTVKRAKQIKRKIPARYEKQTHLILETKGKVNGRTSKKQETTTPYADDEFTVVSRDSMQWKIDKFKDKYGHFLNAVAATLTGAIITSALHIGEYVSTGAAIVMVGVTAAVGVTLAVIAHNKS